VGPVHASAATSLASSGSEIISTTRKLCAQNAWITLDGIVAQRVSLGAGIDDKFSPWREIRAGVLKASLKLWREAALDFNHPEIATGQAQQQINLGSRESCGKNALGRPPAGRNTDLNGETRKARSGDRVAEDLLNPMNAWTRPLSRT